MTQPDERSVGNLIADATQDMSKLVRDELELAKAELRQSVARAASGVGMFGGAAFLGYVAFLMLSVAAAYGLVAAGLHPALGFLGVAVFYLLLSGLLVYIGIRNLKRVRGPEQAVAEWQETKQMLTSRRSGERALTVTGGRNAPTGSADSRSDGS